MSSIIIVNKKQPNSQISYDIKKYCGRGSVLGNEFSFMKMSQFETSQVKDRDEACDKMRLMLLKYLMDDKNLFPKSHKVKEAFNEIYSIYRKGNKLALECYCQNSDEDGIVDGKRCHTEDIREIVYTVERYINNGENPREALLFLKNKWNI